MGNFNINKAGFVIVGIFVLTWVVALSIWRFGKIEQKWEAAAEGPRDQVALSRIGDPVLK